MANIPTSSSALTIIMFVAAIGMLFGAMSIKKFKIFFSVMFLGCALAFITCLQNLYELNSLSKVLLTDTSVARPMTTCPEYWKKVSQNNTVSCISKNSLNGNTSIGNIDLANDGINNELFTREINISQINSVPDTARCNAIFGDYYNVDAETAANAADSEKKNITWLEYQTKCIK